MNEYQYEILSERLKYLRKKKKISQEKLSELLDSYPKFIGNIETGVHTPSIDTLLKLSEYFNVSIDFLLGNEFTKSDKLETTLSKLSDEQYKTVMEFAEFLLNKNNGS